jgi:molybdopterin-guanine dinucleotide biosynthesis protein A
VIATLAILAGGEGRRMGRPKGELRVDGQPILTYLLDRFAWRGPTILVTAPGRERPPGVERFDREVTDPVASEGPLRGVLTALAAATETQVLVATTCDMPRIEGRQLRWLAEEIARQPEAQIVMPSPGGQPEPFPLALRRTALPLLTDHFGRGGRSMHSILQIAGAVLLPVPDDWPDTTWANLNTPGDLGGFRDLTVS